MSQKLTSSAARIAGVLVVVGAVVLAIGINRIVVTNGTIAVATHEQRLVTDFKSDYFPLER